MPVKKAKEPKIPRQYSLCKFDIPKYEHEWYEKNYPKELLYEHVVFLGEIPNMPDHCVVAAHKSGKVYCGYHTFNFVELTEDET